VLSSAQSFDKKSGYNILFDLKVTQNRKECGIIDVLYVQLFHPAFARFNAFSIIQSIYISDVEILG
jgi:hypothetical protein